MLLLVITFLIFIYIPWNHAEIQKSSPPNNGVIADERIILSG